MSGTDLAYGATACYAMSGTDLAYGATTCYAMSGTDLAYGATSAVEGLSPQAGGSGSGGRERDGRRGGSGGERAEERLAGGEEERGRAREVRPHPVQTERYGPTRCLG
eukprot:2166953-Rhodomonas_salina.1